MSYFKVKSCRNLINNFKIEDFMETRGIDLLIEMQMYVAAEQALVNTFNFRKNWNIKTFNTKYLKLDVGNTQEVNNFKVQYVYKPRYLNHLNFSNKPYKITLERTGAFHLKEKCSIINGWHVINENSDLLIHERASEPGLGFSSGLFEIQWPHESYGKLNSKKSIIAWKEISVEKIDNGILLGPRVDNNYFKFLIDYVSRLKFLNNLDSSHVYPLLIKKQDLPQLNQIIKILEKDFQIKFIEKNIRYEMQQLIIPTPMNYHPDSTNISWKAASSFDVENLIWLKHYFFKKFKIGEEKSHRKIYINSSRSYRVMENQSEVCNFFESLNYEIVDPSQMTFEQQVTLFNQVSHVCGPSGAWIANMVFMPFGSKVTVLISSALKKYRLHANMAKALNLKFNYLTGTPNSSLLEHSWREGWLHSDYSIRLKDLSKILQI